MRLLDLIAEKGTTAEAAAVAVGVKPLLLYRIDAGLQPMPAFLADVLAAVLGAERWEVAAACPLNTDLTSRVLLNPIPPRLGEPTGTLQVTATLPVFPTAAPPHPSVGNRVVAGADSVIAAPGNQVIVGSVTFNNIVAGAGNNVVAGGSGNKVVG